MFRGTHWSDLSLVPLDAGILEYQQLLATKITDLRHSGASRRTIQTRVQVLHIERARLAACLLTLHRLRQAAYPAPPPVSLDVTLNNGATEPAAVMPAQQTAPRSGL